MNSDTDTLVQLFWRGVTAPRAAAVAVLEMGVPRAALFPLAGLVATLLAAFMFLQGLFLGPPTINQPDGTVQQFEVSPILFALVAFGFMVIYSWALAFFGQKLGGRGTLENALLLVVYLQGLLLGFQAIELVLVVLSLAPLAMLVATGAFFFGFWLNLVFVDVLHGYDSMLKSFVLLIAVSAAFAVAIMTVLGMVGVRLA